MDIVDPIVTVPFDKFHKLVVLVEKENVRDGVVIPHPAIMPIHLGAGSSVVVVVMLVRNSEVVRRILPCSLRHQQSS